MKVRHLFSLGLLALVAGITSASASMFVAMTAEQLIDEADAVIQGRVIRLESRWDENGRIVVTEATVEVTDTIVGEAAPEIVVRTPGGKVADFRVEAIGFPQMYMGEEVILFVKADRAIGASRIVGHQQGHFEVVTRKDGVTLAVPRIEEDAAFLLPSGKPMPQPRSSELGAFKGRLRAEAARLGKRVQ